MGNLKRLNLLILRNVSSVGSEHYFDRVGVTGSSPVRSTFNKLFNLPSYISMIHSLQKKKLHYL